MRYRLWRIAAFPILFIAPMSCAQEPVLPALTVETHAMDSLLGAWSIVENTHSADPRYAQIKGTWVFSRAADGFMIVDEFRLFNRAGQTAFLAETYRAFNPARKNWTFRATTFQSPLIRPISGDWDSGVTRIQGNEIVDESNKGNTITRVRIHNLTNDGFFCSVQKSRDGGNTWTTSYEIDARREK